jgi:hypothetical protein
VFDLPVPQNVLEILQSVDKVRNLKFHVNNCKNEDNVNIDTESESTITHATSTTDKTVKILYDTLLSSGNKSGKKQPSAHQIIEKIISKINPEQLNQVRA